jgi:fermentation-respiration switch protein FrsA (DUF1100 family)
MLGYIVLGVLFVFMLALFIACWLLSNIILKPKVIPYDTLLQKEIDDGRMKKELYDSWEKKDFTIKSRYGYDLSCQLINNDKSNEQFENPADKRKIAILCHGYTCGKYSSMIYADMFLQRGITVLAYDHRNHGLSGKASTTMGYYEKFDLQTVLDWCYEEYGANLAIVTHGESMGAATVLLHLAIDGRVRCTIADCGYSSLERLLKHQLKTSYRLPAFPFLYVAKLIVKLRTGFWLDDVEPWEGAVHSNVPILFVHGAEDNYVPYTMSMDMYDMKQGKKEIYLAKGAGHAVSCQTNRKEYQDKLNKFLNEYYFIDNKF